MKHVILSEKWDKKAAKYTTPQVPFPFDNKETYERSIRQVGKLTNLPCHGALVEPHV